MQLENILQEINNDSVKNRDFEMNFSKLRMSNDGKLFSIDKQDKEGSILSDFATTQLLTKSEMPVRYMKKLFEVSPQLVAEQFNLWSSRQEEDKKVLIRGQHGKDGFFVRGVLSDKYTILDNKDVLDTLIGVSDTVPDFQVESVFNNDKKLHVRLSFPDLFEDFGTSVEGKNDIIRVGLDIQNSEVGYSSLMIAPITYRLVCTNGLKMWKQEEGAFKQRHVHMGSNELKDLLKVTMSTSIEKGKELIEGMRASRQISIDNPYKYIDGIVLEYSLSNKMGERIKEAYDVEPEKNLYSILNAFTRTGRDIGNHDSRMKLETIASSLMLVA
jgi:hypothetical protein